MVIWTASNGKLFHTEIELGKNEYLKWFVRAKGILYCWSWLHLKKDEGGTVCIWRVVATTASGIERMASYCQVESLVYDRQLPRRLGHGRAPVVSWFQDASERLFDFVMAPTLAWLQRCFGDGLVALSMLKHNAQRHYTTLKIQKCNTGNGTVYVIRPSSTYYMNHSNEVHSIVMQQISYYMAPRAHMPNTGTRGHVITNTY